MTTSFQVYHVGKITHRVVHLLTEVLTSLDVVFGGFILNLRP